VEAAPQPTALKTVPGQRPTPVAGGRGRTPGTTSQLRPARQLQFPPEKGPDGGDGVKLL